MGRGRAKAKQTKVARELKYSTPSTDLSALQRELASGGGAPAHETNGDGAGPATGSTDLDDSDEGESDEFWVASR